MMDTLLQVSVKIGSAILNVDTMMENEHIGHV